MGVKGEASQQENLDSHLLLFFFGFALKSRDIKCLYVYSFAYKSKSPFGAGSAPWVVRTKYYADPLDIFPRVKYSSLCVRDIPPSYLVAIPAENHHYEIVIS